MFLLNPGRYIIADPEIALGPDTFKKLQRADMKCAARLLRTVNGAILALTTGKNGEFATDLGRSITTASGQIAFLPCCAAERLLPVTVIRIALVRPALLFFNASSNIVLDGKLTIFCSGPSDGGNC